MERYEYNLTGTFTKRGKYLNHICSILSSSDRLRWGVIYIFGRLYLSDLKKQLNCHDC